MSALRIKVGELWWTGVPTREAAQVVSFAQVSSMQMRSGPDWAAQVPWDLKQKGVAASFSITREFESVAAMAAWLSDVLSADPDHEWQADIIFRWEHEDGIGYTESLMPWGALRIGSIAHDGPRTLRMQCQALGPELEDYALYMRGVITTRAGQPIATTSGRPLGTHYQLITAP